MYRTKILFPSNCIKKTKVKYENAGVKHDFAENTKTKYVPSLKCKTNDSSAILFRVAGAL